jgi:glutamate 5-kinase
MGLLGMKKRPSDISELQATASIGQNYLMRLYGECLKSRGYIIGQILLTQEDFNERKRYLNIKHTVEALLAHNAIPIINENDTVATDEIRCGDNDRISSLVSDLCQADKLIILTDVEGLMDEKGSVIRSVDEVTAKIARLGGRSPCDLGTGGMATKIEAARYVTAAGIECVVADGGKRDVILNILEGESVGTTFRKKEARFIARKRWIAYSSKSKGTLTVDSGAKEAVSKKDKSLLASGILAVKGSFRAGDVVSIADREGEEFARGLVNYSSDEINRVKGHGTSDFKDILGRKGRDEVIHKDDLVVL